MENGDVLIALLGQEDGCEDLPSGSAQRAPIGIDGNMCDILSFPSLLRILVGKRPSKTHCSHQQVCLTQRPTVVVTMPSLTLVILVIPSSCSPDLHCEQFR